VRRQDQYIVGLDIGTRKICVVVGEVMSDGGLDIIGIGSAESRGVRRGKVVDVESAVGAISRAMDVRLYHFAVIAIQSLVLLGSSYLIRNPHRFVVWLIALFALEVLWYVGCRFFIRSAVSDESGNVNRMLLRNEYANLGLVVASTISLVTLPDHSDLLAIAVGLFFAVNTAIDLQVNLASYMGGVADKQN
jgi:hypothetical protein